jgi:hypothetical protein
MEEGIEVGRLAMQQVPNGVLVAERDTATAVQRTRQLMGDPTVPAIFEATFITDDYVTKADILKREKEGWHLIEVKSRINDSPELIDDIAYTATVMARAGTPISGATLWLVSGDLRRGMGEDQLFAPVEHTGEVQNRMQEFSQLWTGLRSQVSAEGRPIPTLIPECRNCPFFSTECLGRGISDPVLDLPRISRSNLQRLARRGAVAIEDIPSGLPLTERQSLVKRSVDSGQPWVSRNLQSDLGKVVWPVYYLDFETVTTALPLYGDVAPYEQIVTQYSLHKRSPPGESLEHYDFLADPSRDCRYRLAQKLVADLGTRGSILVYTGFERRILEGLASQFQDLAPAIQAMIPRLVDLAKIIRENFYHPAFHGSISIKRTLPVLVPDMSYEDLAIQDGTTASAEFAYLARGRYSAEETAEVQASLLAYCKQDTLAMVRIHDRLLEMG